MKQHYSTIALTWAQSLLDLANEQGQTESVANDVQQLEQLIEQNRDFADFLSSPGISNEERANALSRIFSGRVSVLQERFLQLMSERGRLSLLPEVLEAFEHLLDEQLGKIEVDVTVAARLSDSELEAVRSRVSQALGRDAVIHQYVDPDIIGGIVLRVGDQVVDASIRRQLEAMRRRLMKR